MQKALSPNNPLRRGRLDVQPVIRGKSLRSKRHNRVSTPFCRPSKEAAVLRKNANSSYQNLEENPCTGQLGLTKLGGNKRRSSIASLSTLKIPRSFRPCFSIGGSSVYSRDTKGMSALPSPGLASEFSFSLKSLAEVNLRRATSFDETIFKNLDCTLQDVVGRHEVSPVSYREKEDVFDTHAPQTPSYPEGENTPETPKVGTASSDTFGTTMPVPKISIARSSDDVFGGGSMAEGRHEVVVESGRVFKRIRVMGSKLSQEDLARYGGSTAPGGVEWF